MLLIHSLMNPARKYIGVIMAISVLSANGFLFSPFAHHQPGDGSHIGMLQECSCGCSSHNVMPGKCCCADGRKTSSNSSCSFSEAPCSSPVLALSPNILDQAIEVAEDVLAGVTPSLSQKYPTDESALLHARQSSLFHPPQIPLSFS